MIAALWIVPAASENPSDRFKLIDLHIQYIGKYNADGRCPNWNPEKDPEICCRWDVVKEAPEIRLAIFDAGRAKVASFHCPNDNYACKVAFAVQPERGPYQLVFTEGEVAKDEHVGSATLNAKTMRVRYGELAIKRLRVRATELATVRWMPRSERKWRDTLDICMRQIESLPFGSTLKRWYRDAPVDAVNNMLKAIRNPKRFKIPVSVGDPLDMLGEVCSPWGRTVRPRAATEIYPNCPCCK